MFNTRVDTMTSTTIMDHSEGTDQLLVVHTEKKHTQQLEVSRRFIVVTVRTDRSPPGPAQQAKPGRTESNLTRPRSPSPGADTDQVTRPSFKSTKIKYVINPTIFSICSEIRSHWGIPGGGGASSFYPE